LLDEIADLKQVVQDLRAEVAAAKFLPVPDPAPSTAPHSSPPARCWGVVLALLTHLQSSLLLAQAKLHPNHAHHVKAVAEFTHATRSATGPTLSGAPGSQNHRCT